MKHRNWLLPFSAAAAAALSLLFFVSCAGASLPSALFRKAVGGKSLFAETAQGICETDRFRVAWQVSFHDREGDIGKVIPISAAEARLTLHSPGDLPQLSRLKNLQSLKLTLRCDADLTPLSELKNLRTLDLSGNYGRMQDISFLEGLKSLEELDLSYNAVTDLTPLRKLSRLRILTLTGNPVEDLSPLDGLPEDVTLQLDMLRVPWNGWGPVSYFKNVTGRPPVENAGQQECPAGWAERIRQAYPESAIIALDYDDYDGDGTFEAFAFLGHSTDELGGYYGKLLFLTAEVMEELKTGRDLEMSAPLYFRGYYRFGRTKIIHMESSTALTSAVSLLWTVRGGQAQEVNISGLGQEFHLDEYGNACLHRSAYDGDSEGSGHSWKPYYFYFNGRDFTEYGAVGITRQQFLELDGAEAILAEAETDGWQVIQILYRGGCGMLHLNLRRYGEPAEDTAEEYYESSYRTFRREGNGLTEIDSDMGNYVPALSDSAGGQPVLAEYPSGWGI